MMKVLFVCLGNICRSPLAEAIFNKKINHLTNRDLFQTDSCGTGNYNVGDLPDPRTVRVAFKNDVPIQHVARQLSRQDIEYYDLVLVMDRHNLKSTLSLAEPHHHMKIKLVRSYDPLGQGDVPDPYYGDEKDFDDVFEILNRSIEKLVDELAR
ncbi:MAG: low molecular weight phosphotyrosine protein phosphatase [Bacteroidetes bacterium]|nr:low molecular weight phosphotyrosine protein phosphatase [Bacteroidota bacterium]MBS1981467.1 low molecular weight phosphotyrosine protein phosphatase [Bacteroidota bacterium]